MSARKAPLVGDHASSAAALCAFGLLYSHCLALQVAMDVRTLAPASSPRLVLTALLGAAIAGIHIFRSSCVVLFALASTALAVLWAHGSQSNHVLLELAVTGAVLLSTPAPSDLLASTARVRAEWSRRLLASLRAILCMLYAVTAFAKMNDDWFDTKRARLPHMRL